MQKFLIILKSIGVVCIAVPLAFGALYLVYILSITFHVIGLIMILLLVAVVAFTVAYSMFRASVEPDEEDNGVSGYYSFHNNRSSTPDDDDDLDMDRFI